jgi:hypothetical protein
MPTRRSAICAGYLHHIVVTAFVLHIKHRASYFPAVRPSRIKLSFSQARHTIDSTTESDEELVLTLKSSPHEQKPTSTGAARSAV